MIPSFDDVLRAEQGLRGIVRETPLLEDPLWNEQLGGRLLLKAECLQRTGSFKVRGAHTMIARLPEAVRARGVVAFSSGNHAQGVAAAARHFGVPATIAMPADAPRLKVEGTRALGARVVPFDREREDRAALAERLAAESGATLVRPYDDPDVIAGQGTVGLEALRQARRAGVALDALLCPCGGGGLVSGCALAFAAESPGTEIWAVEPEGFDDTRRSLAAGERVANAPGARSICDAILTEMPGALPFELQRRLLAGALSVGDEEVADAVREAFARLKVVVEPAGAAALAAVLSGRLDLRGRAVAVVLSGGNVDPETFARILAG